MLNRLALAAACTLLASCATASGDYPSLAVREAERVTGRLDAPEPYVPEPISEATLADVEQLVAQAAEAHESFLQKLAPARSAVRAAQGAGVGTERWSVASVAIADVESARSRTMVAMADLDRLYVAAATEGAATEELATAQQRVDALVEQETAAIEDMLAALAR